MRCAILTCANEAIRQVDQVTLGFADRAELVFVLDDGLGFCPDHGSDSDLHDLAVSVLAAARRCGRSGTVDPFRLRNYRIGFQGGQEAGFMVAPGSQA